MMQELWLTRIGEEASHTSLSLEPEPRPSAGPARDSKVVRRVFSFDPPYCVTPPGSRPRQWRLPRQDPWGGLILAAHPRTGNNYSGERGGVFRGAVEKEFGISRFDSTDRPTDGDSKINNCRRPREINNSRAAADNSWFSFDSLILMMNSASSS